MVNITVYGKYGEYYLTKNSLLHGPTKEVDLSKEIKA